MKFVRTLVISSLAAAAASYARKWLAQTQKPINANAEGIDTFGEAAPTVEHPERSGPAPVGPTV